MPFTDPYVANPYPYAYSQTLTSANTLYEISQTLIAGTYTISWSGGGTLTIDFYNGITYLGSATGTSPIIYNLSTSITNYKMWNTSASTSVVISLTALSLAPSSGTLYTFTTSQTISLIGDAYCVLVGGGGGGGAGSGGGLANVTGGGGGGSGYINGGRIYLTGSISLTIGNKGTGGTAATTFGNGGAGTPGTATILGSITANPGLGGTGGQNNVPGNGGVGGGSGGQGLNNTSGAPGSSGSPSPTAASIFSFFTQGTTGGGGGGGSTNVGGGSGIGTGGGGSSSPITLPTGYGAGGGGTYWTLAGQDGTAGICYIII